jgi:signal transduction histidine kinase
MIASVTPARERIGRADVAIAGALSLLGLLLMYGNVVDPEVEASPLAIPLFLMVTVPLLWRRSRPIAAVALSLLGLVIHQLLFGADVIRCGVALPTAFVFAFTAGRQLEGRDTLIALSLALGIVLAEGIAFLGLFAVVIGAITVAMWAIGRIARSRGRMADELEARTAELREARDERARLEVASDRARLSRELDELLQRRLGELARLADEGSRPSEPAAAAAVLAEIERESRRTLEEMRGVVGVLRDDSADEAPTSPQPTLTHLEALLVRATGRDARLTVEGSPRVLPAAVELSAYRIVEHLLDALGQADDVGVTVRFRDDALELAVAGPARRRAKASIERARERARLERGTLEATVQRGRAEAVVSLPVFRTA